MKTVCDLCKRLNNPIRIELLRRAYTSLDGGVNVGIAQDKSGVGVSGTSQYLKQLEDLGILRRERSGKYVNYIADWSAAPAPIAEIAAMLKARFKKGEDVESLVPYFNALMNPFRARVVKYLAKGGDGSKEAIADKFTKFSKTLDRDLKSAVTVGLLTCDDADEGVGTYAYHPPTDEIVLKIIESVE